MLNIEQQKPRILIAYLSSELENFFVQEIAICGYEVLAFPFKNIASIRQSINWANAIFVQWDGRGQLGQGLLLELQKTSEKCSANLYAVTASSIRIEGLNERLSRQLGIARWFDLPKEGETLKTELAQLIPDQFDDFSKEIETCELTFVKDFPYADLGSKHLVDEIKSAWDARFAAAEAVTRIKDEVRRRHITIFHSTETRVAELKSMLTSVNFKCSIGFSDLVSCTRWLRTNGTDCLIVWCGENSHDSESLLRMYTEARSFRRVPLLVLYSSEVALADFKKRNPDLFIDQFIFFDRQREKFEGYILASLSRVDQEASPRKILDDLRTTSLDFPPPSSIPLSVGQVEIACDAIAAEPGKMYWAEVEHALAAVRFGNGSRQRCELQLKYGTFDALLNDTAVRCSQSREEAESATQYMVNQLMSLSDLNFERIVRASILLTRTGCTDALKNFLNMWWTSSDRFPASFEFYWAASRWAQQTGSLALERAFLGIAIKMEPLRNEIVESYANHLLATDHTKQVYQLGEFLSRSRYFPLKKSQMILINVLVKINDKVGASLILAQMIARSPHDKQLIKLKTKLGIA